MKIALLADTHLSATKYNKTDKTSGLSRFMVRQFESLEWVRSYLKAHGIDTIVHAGDLFDSAAVNVYPVVRTKSIFDGFNVYAIKGNHDDTSILHSQEISALDLVGIDSINTPQTRTIANINFVFIPYGYEIDTSLLDITKKNVLIAHGYIRPEFYHDEGAKDVLDDTKMQEFDLVVAGHNHTMAHFIEAGTEYLVPGSLSNYANDYKERPYLWILDTDTLELEKVAIECGLRKYKLQTDTPNEYLENIDEEALYQLIVPITSDVDKKVLHNSQMKALDIQISYTNSRVSEIQIEERKTFWDYVAENSDYLERFQKIAKEELNAIQQ